MEYMTALLIWISKAETPDQARPHCVQLLAMLDANKSKGEGPWAACNADKACSVAQDQADDALDENCDNEGW